MRWVLEFMFISDDVVGRTLPLNLILCLPQLTGNQVMDSIIAHPTFRQGVRDVVSRLMRMMFCGRYHTTNVSYACGPTDAPNRD